MSNVILYMAISVDGFVAGPNDETPWSDQEWVAFQDFVKTCDICLLGRRTYEVMRDSGEFVAGPKYIVVTDNTAFDTGQYEKLSIKAATDMPTAQKVGVIGGGDLNGRLAQLGVLDEIILDIEPITLGAGKRLFGNREAKLNLKLLSTRQIGGNTIQNHYKVER